MQGNRDYAIAYLEHIDKGGNNQATDDTILAKSLLHLGRLYFKAGTYELSHKFLNKFYRKSKNLDTKELLDIARVNLGMIDGTQDMESYINKIKNKTYKNNFELSRNNNNIRIFKSPNITPNYINTFQDNNNEYIKPKNYRKINDNIISPERNINIMTLKNRLNTPTYYKVPINLTNRLSKSPDLKGTFDIQNRLNDEVKVLNFGGKKIFTTNSFNGLSNSNISNNNNNTVVKNRNSELFRNYNELKKKKEEIFRRKMKRDSSTNGQELLKNQKDKEIKQQKIGVNKEAQEKEKKLEEELSKIKIENENLKNKIGDKEIKIQNLKEYVSKVEEITKKGDYENEIMKLNLDEIINDDELNLDNKNIENKDNIEEKKFRKEIKKL